MWTFRRLLRIHWTAHITNEEVLEICGFQRELLYTVRQRKVHIERNR